MGLSFFITSQRLKILYKVIQLTKEIVNILIDVVKKKKKI